MTKYRDSLGGGHGNEIGSVVGCGLDRLEREVTDYEIQAALMFYEDHKNNINKLPISEGRQAIADYISNGFQMPSYIKT